MATQFSQNLGGFVATGRAKRWPTV